MESKRLDTPDEPSDETLRKLKANLELLRRTGFYAVPTLLYRTRDGKADVIRGAPPAPVLEKLLKELE